MWWKETENGFRFLDSDLDEDYHQEGPHLCHFRSCTLDTIETRSTEKWKEIMDYKTKIPTTVLRIFDEAGDFVSCIRDGIDQNDQTPPFDDVCSSTGDTCTCNSISTTNPVPVTSTPFSCNSVSVSANPSISPPISTFSIMRTSTPIASPPTCNIASPTVIPIRSLDTCNSQKADSCTPSRTAYSAKVKRRPVIKHKIGDGQVDEDNCCIAEDEAPSTGTHQLNSKHARLMANILGYSSDLYRLDQLHVQLKSGSGNKSIKEEYLDLLAVFQSKVLKAKLGVTNEIKGFEKDYYKQHTELPTHDNQVYSILVRKPKHCKALLRSWNITL